MPIVFSVSKTIPPPTWQDFTTYQYWMISDGLGAWDDDNSRWVAVNENIELVPAYPWPTDFRPESIRFTHTSGVKPDFRLYDTNNDLIASADAVTSGDVIPITFGSYDIGRLVIVSNQTTTFRVKPIEFNTSYDPYEVPYSAQWSSTEKSVDMTIDPNSGIHTYKLPDVGNAARSILNDHGYIANKWYFEVRMRGNGVALTNSSMGIRQLEITSGVNYEGGIGNNPGRGHGYWAQGRFYSEGSLITDNPASWATASRWIVLGCAVDMTNGYAWFSKDGIWQGAVGTNPDPVTGTDPAITGLTGVWYPAVALYYHTGIYFSEAWFEATSENIKYLPAGFSPWDPI